MRDVAKVGWLWKSLLFNRRWRRHSEPVFLMHISECSSLWWYSSVLLFIKFWTDRKFPERFCQFLQLETFKRTLMQSLQEEDDKHGVCFLILLLPFKLLQCSALCFQNCSFFWTYPLNACPWSKVECVTLQWVGEAVGTLGCRMCETRLHSLN